MTIACLRLVSVLVIVAWWSTGMQNKKLVAITSNKNSGKTKIDEDSKNIIPSFELTTDQIDYWSTKKNLTK